jgi:hypothetical protein
MLLEELTVIIDHVSDSFKVLLADLQLLILQCKVVVLSWRSLVYFLLAGDSFVPAALKVVYFVWVETEVEDVADDDYVGGLDCSSSVELDFVEPIDPKQS